MHNAFFVFRVSTLVLAGRSLFLLAAYCAARNAGLRIAHTHARTHTHRRPTNERCEVRSAGVADWKTARRGDTERTLTAAAGPSPRAPYRHALAVRSPRKVRPFGFLNYYYCACKKRLGVNCEPGGGGGRKSPKAPPPGAPRRAPFMTKGFSCDPLFPAACEAGVRTEGRPRQIGTSRPQGRTHPTAVSGSVFHAVRERFQGAATKPLLRRAQARRHHRGKPVA